MKYLLFLLSIIFVFSAYAEEAPDFIAKYGNWTVYTQLEDVETVCFIESPPVNEAGNYKKRGESHLWVRHIKNKVDEVSTTTGYSSKNSTFPKVAIYNKQGFEDVKSKGLMQEAKKGKCFSNSDIEYSLDLLQNEIAWFREGTIDEKLVQLMKKKYFAVITATSPKDTCSTDVYSLMGFTKAYSHMKSLCAS